MQTSAETTTAKRTPKSFNVSVADYISQQIEVCGKSQLEIAREAGFNKPNIITMLKQGRTKVPVSKVGPLAKALGVDAMFLFQLVMREYEPETWAGLEQYVFKNPVVSQNEMEIIELIRQSKVPNPKIRTQEEKQKLLDFVSTLRPENASLYD